jgi:hypothetical protein
MTGTRVRVRSATSCHGGAAVPIRRQQVAALSEATADVFDALLPWVETELQQGVARAR